MLVAILSCGFTLGAAGAEPANCLGPLVFCSSCPAAAPCPLPGEWTVIKELTDEFDGDALDAEKWHDHNPTWLGRKPGYFSKNNVTVSDGRLHLTARAEALPDLPEGYHTFTTAAVKSKTKVLYGYFEIKCRPMDSRASSAFWFYAQEPKWWTEIDVFEICGREPKHERIVHQNVHVFKTPEEDARHWSKPKGWTAPFRLADDFHTYGLLWNKAELKFFVDGDLVRTIDNTHWHQPLHMNFDSETMPNWFGLPAKENLPSTFSIEYVRSWRPGSPP
jgi:beta-glucanase (GH16 family)